MVCIGVYLNTCVLELIERVPYNRVFDIRLFFIGTLRVLYTLGDTVDLVPVTVHYHRPTVSCTGTYSDQRRIG